MLMSFKSFSQTVTTPYRTTDTTVVILPSSIAKRVVKELILFDSAKEEIRILNEVIKSKDSVEVTFIRIIKDKDAQINNLQSAIMLTQEQFETQEELRKRLEVSLKATKAKNKILKVGVFGGTAAGILIGILLTK